MEAILKVDKFGRILIPKKIREVGGYTTGTKLKIKWDAEQHRLSVVSLVPEVEPVLTVDELGIPTFDFGTNEVFQYDFTEAIKHDRETRGDKNLGFD